jgi:hypothetical protein
MTYYAAIGPFCRITISLVSNRSCQQQTSGVLVNKKAPFYWQHKSVFHGPSVSRYSDWLRAGWSGDRIPVVARFSAPVQTGLGAHPASCTMGTGPLSEGLKRPGRGVDHPPQSSAEVKKSVELYLYPPFVPSLPVLGWRLLLPLPSVFLQHYLIFFQVCITFIYC